MRKRTRLVGFIFCLLLVLPVTSRAAGSAGPSYRALVIGNEEYPNHSRLEGAGNDAKKIVGMFEGQCFLENRSFESIKLARNLTGQEILEEIAENFRDNEEGDVSYIYYAGHGAIYQGESVLVGVDMNYLGVESLEARLRELKGTFVIILDSCNSGGFANDEDDYDADSFNQGVSRAFFPTARARSLLRQEKYIVLTAAGKQGLSYEKDLGSDWGPGGMFTEQLLLGNGYDGNFRADSNGDYLVSIKEIYDYIRRRLNISQVQVYADNPKFIFGGQLREALDPEALAGLEAWPRTYEDVGKTDIWQLRFNREIDLESSEIYFLNSHKLPIAADYEIHQDGRGLDIKNYSYLRSGSDYSLIIGEGIRSGEARHGKNIRLDFTAR